MKGNRRKFICFILLFILVIFPIATLADSGWDSSYDSGGSSSYHSGSYSSYDGGSHSGGSSHRSSSGGGFVSSLEYKPVSITFIIILFAIVVLTLIIAVVSNLVWEKSKKKKNKEITLPTGRISYQILTDEEIQKIDPTLNVSDLKNIVFNVYKKVQIAWMNFDYQILQKYLTDELYNSYKMELETLEMKGEQNIMENINMLGAGVTKVSIENGYETVVMTLSVSMLDYVIEKSNEKVLRGLNYKPINIKYEITLVRKVTDISDNKTCPSCGSQIASQNIVYCPSCGNKIVVDTNNFVMSKKENIGQW